MTGPNSKDLIELSGHVVRITYRDPQSGFTVAQVDLGSGCSPITVVGALMAFSPGEVLQIKGYWVNHSDFGRQFRAVSCQTKMPVTQKGIEKYLGSGSFKGIGPQTARRIVGYFGNWTLEIIDQTPQRLTQVGGIGPKKANAIQRAWHDQKEIRDTMLFLQSHGISTAQASKIFLQYGPETIAMIQQDPYRLARDIFGIGFQTADRIAEQMGLTDDAPVRVRAGVRYLLYKLTEEGHLYYLYEDLIDKTLALLGIAKTPIVAVIADMAKEGQLIIENFPSVENQQTSTVRAVYPPHLLQCETFTAQHLKNLLKAPLYKETINTQRALIWIQKQLDLQLAQGQLQAVAMALTHKVLVITGGPGTGKTTIIRAIARLYGKMQAAVLLAAPTGRAAKRISETTGRPAATIHRLLAYHPHQGGFQRNQDNPIDADLLVIDEASMINAVLMYHLLKAIPIRTTLILTGDVNQLPPVGPGNVLKDILSSGAVPQVTLTEIYRQAKTSQIVVNAHRINNGQFPDLSRIATDGPGDFYFIEQQDPDQIASTILTLSAERIPRRFGFDPIDDIQVLTPMYRGAVGADNLNQWLQNRLNPQEAFVGRGEQRFCLNDKVMQIRNNYEKDIFNGDLGRIAQIEPHRKKIAIRFDDNMVFYDFDELEQVTLAYAVTVHKSQGSEYPAVIIPVTTQHYLMLQRNLIYTAITRAKNLVVLIGTKRALAMAVKNDKPQQRNTRLAQRLSSKLS